MDHDFRLGEWLVQPTRNRIQGVSGASTIKPKSMAVLVQLAEAQNQVVRKQDLMDEVWGQALVTEDVLTQCIVELRKAFDDSASEPKIIETIRRVGYRLIPTVEAVAAPTQGHSSTVSRLKWASALALIAIGIFWYTGTDTPTNDGSTSIAVLPFLNLSDDPNNAYFGDGLAEELLDRLTKVPGLQVPARTSSFAFRDSGLDVPTIGHRLGVENVLEGSVRRSDDTIRITVQLIDVASGNHTWSDTYQREMGDVFAVQDEISDAIVSALRPKLGASPEFESETYDIAAYDLYLLGRHHLRQERTTKAREFFERAIQQDPGFARAYAGLAESFLFFRDTPASLWHTGSGSLDRAAWAVDQALGLNPRLPEAYTAQAALYAVQGKIDDEHDALRKALELKPGFAEAQARLADSLAAQGRYQEALSAYEKALPLDPLNPDINAALCRLTALTRGYDAALVYPLTLLDSELPSPQIYQVLMSLSGDFGRYDERIKWGLRLVNLIPERADALAELADAFMEVGELELAQMWVQKAVELSPARAFKAHTRLLYASGQVDEFESVAASTFERYKPEEGEPLNLVQATVIPIYAISRFETGDYEEAAYYINRILEESPALPRRPPHLGMYARALLADSYQRLGDRTKAVATANEALAIATRAQAQGVQNYPPLTRELAKAHAVLGDRDKAFEYLSLAVAQGWRQVLLETRGPGDTVGELLGGDTQYQRLLQQVEMELEEMRRIVRRNGWDVTPAQFFANK